ncbi:MAG TPA: hypothetical protein VNH18_34490 [Bryobacteraceae bacterium]|nr:hypothetical protein [Bryobacteraceae bacterium]
MIGGDLAPDSASARLRQVATIVVPIAFLLWLYREGIDVWFMQDDFAWLSLLRQVHSWQDVVRVLFEPAAQGTIRPWSERGFFLLFEYLFGVDNYPFRLAAFTTAAADIVLIGWIVRRLSGSRVAAAIAGITWAANASLVVVMTWSSAWNEVLCPFFLLSALALFIRYTESGRKGFWWLQLAFFVVGFGALEINVVYPAIALAWSLFVTPSEKRRRFATATVPLFVVSIVYFLIHRAVAPLPQSGAYALHFNPGMLRTLAVYLKWSLLPADWAAWKHSRALGRLILGSGILSLAALAVFEFRRRRTVTLFFASWFLITIAPLVPLSNHQSDYYLTIPVIGVGMLAGWSVSCAWRGVDSSTNRRWQILPVLAVCLYLTGMIPVARAATAWWAGKAEAVRVMVLGVEAAHRAHPDSAIVLDGITTDLFNNAIGHSPFFPLGIQDVYLAPGSELKIKPAPELADLRDIVLEPAVLQKGLTADRIVLYSLSGDHLRNITENYRRSAPDRLSDRLPSRVDIGNSLYSWLVGPEWLPLEAGFRWMPQRATVRMGVPETVGNKLSLDGYCPLEQLQRAPRHLVVSADGIVLGQTQIKDPESMFHRLFPMPDSLAGKKSIEIEIRVDPTERIGERDLGLIFGRLAILP